MKNQFNETDYTLRRCKKTEIGQPWEDRWSIDDLIAGDCSEGQVGLAKGAPPPVPEQPPAFAPLTKAERRRLTQELSDKLLLLAHENPAAFLDGAGPQINKFLDAASRIDLDERPDPLPVTPEQIKAMSTDDVKAYVVRSTMDAKRVTDALLPLIAPERRPEAMRVLADLQRASERL